MCSRMLYRELVAIIYSIGLVYCQAFIESHGVLPRSGCQNLAQVQNFIVQMCIPHLSSCLPWGIPHFPREVSSGLLTTGRITNLHVCKTNIPPGVQNTVNAGQHIIDYFFRSGHFLWHPPHPKCSVSTFFTHVLCFPLFTCWEEYMQTSTSLMLGARTCLSTKFT